MGEGGGGGEGGEIMVLLVLLSFRQGVGGESTVFLLGLKKKSESFNQHINNKIILGLSFCLKNMLTHYV